MFSNNILSNSLSTKTTGKVVQMNKKILSGVFTIFFVLFSVSTAYATTTYYVRTDGDDTLCNGLFNQAQGIDNPDCAFLTIQKAISAANADDTVSVAAGTYVEVGQIVISKDLSIVGVDKTTTIIKPFQDTGVGNHQDANAWILVNSGVTFNLRQVTLDGSGRLINHGILSHGHGVIDDNIFSNIGYNPSGPDYKGIGIELYGSDMTVSNNQFNNIGRIGVYTGFASVATISNNVYNGKGDGNFLDYGFEVGRNGQATILSNTISNCRGVATVDGSTSAGILVTTYYGPAQATITGNTITNSDTAIAVGYDAFDTSVVTAMMNKFSGNNYGVATTAPFVNAENNYWNCTTGPNTAGCAKTDGDVDFAPYYKNVAMTSLSDSYSVCLTGCNFVKIQTAVNYAPAGDKINVGAGIYDEQIIINKTLTLQGDGVTTIIKPTQTTANNFKLFNRKAGGSINTAPIIAVTSAGDINVNVRRLKVDGSSISSLPVGANMLGGILYRASSGMIDSVRVEDIAIADGNGIYLTSLGNTVSVEVKDSFVSDYLKNGITANFAGMTANIHDNKVIGAGPRNDIAANGIQIGFGAAGTISKNTVTDNYWTGTYGGSNDPATDPNADGATGILLYHPGSSVEVKNNNITGNQFGVWSVGAVNVNIHDNTITGSSGTGIAIWDSDMWTDDFGLTEVGTVGAITSNIITSHDYGIMVKDYTAGGVVPNVAAHNNKITGSSNYAAWSNIAFDAENNWWGGANGPYDATGSVEVPPCTDSPANEKNTNGLATSSVSDNVDYCPWLQLQVTMASPEPIAYDTNGIMFTVSTNIVADVIEYSLDSQDGSYRKLCAHCDFYNVNKNFLDGNHTLTVRAKLGSEIATDGPVSFSVDSDKPKIIKILPEDGDVVSTTFYIKYTEKNLVGVFLWWNESGPGVYTKAPLSGCLPGKNKECSLDLNLGSYDGKSISFYFEINDSANTVKSPVRTIKIDNTNPVVTITSPENKSYSYRRIDLAATVTETVEKLEYSLDGGSFKKLCKDCNGDSMSKTFSNGQHILTVRATDYAGNVGESTRQFYVDDKAPKVTINSPKAKTYKTDTIVVDIGVNEKVKLEYSDNGVTFEELCNDCNSYLAVKTFSPDAYTLQVRATDKVGNVGTKSVAFKIQLLL